MLNKYNKTDVGVDLLNKQEKALETELNRSDYSDKPENLMAAVDLGSNSFHMVISRYEHGQFSVIDRQKKSVRLAAGLDEYNYLTQEASERALTTLNEFAQLLKHLKKKNVRVVATNAMRRMENKAEFLELAEKVLGHNIEIIAGREEARLIYLGVSKWSEGGNSSRLVIDIGGGSTEVIIGQGDTPIIRESLEIGCVVITNQFFSDGVLSKGNFDKAKIAAELAIMPVIKQFKAQGWESALGCSGSMKSLASIVQNMGWSKEGITKGSVAKLVEYAIQQKHLDNLNLEGLNEDRKPVFAGGLAILMALFDVFELEILTVSEISLREGVLYDLIGRSSDKDVRQITVEAFLKKWSVDFEYGLEVKSTALELYDKVAVGWDIQDDIYKLMLAWASKLHQLGLLISHDNYHKHGAYLVANADMAGFAKRDQLLLSALIYGHRRKFPLSRFESLPSSLVTPAKRLAILLRLSTLLCRGRIQGVHEKLDIDVKNTTVKLMFEPNWLQQHPLTKADLDLEKGHLKAIGYKLLIS